MPYGKSCKSALSATGLTGRTGTGGPGKNSSSLRPSAVIRRRYRVQLHHHTGCGPADDERESPRAAAGRGSELEVGGGREQQPAHPSSDGDAARSTGRWCGGGSTGGWRIRRRREPPWKRTNRERERRLQGLGENAICARVSPRGLVLSLSREKFLPHADGSDPLGEQSNAQKSLINREASRGCIVYTLRCMRACVLVQKASALRTGGT